MSISDCPKTLTALAAIAVLCGCAVDRTFQVNTTQDVSDANPGDDICAVAGSSLCSLRAAVEETNSQPAGSNIAIEVEAGTYDLSGDPLELTHDDVIITGAGAGQTILEQPAPDGVLDNNRVFEISTAGKVLIRSLTIRAGDASFTQSGGAVRADLDLGSILTFSLCEFSDNRADFRGGAVAAIGSGVVNVIGCSLRENRSTSDGCNEGGGQSGGGAIYVEGPSLNVIESELTDNCGSNGGAVMALGGLNHLILRSTFADNEAATRGGGLYFVAGAEGRIDNSTIARNAAPEGTALQIDPTSAVEMINTTINANIRNLNSDQVPDEPRRGVSLIVEPGGSIDITNSVIADDETLNADCLGDVTSSGGNLIGQWDNDCDVSPAQPTDQLDAGDPGLGTLQLLGGPTRVMLPQASSPLVNQGIADCGPIDQREQPAPVGGCDIGSVERQ